MTDFKVGDRVRRVGQDNGEHGACIGTIATVTWVDGDGYISVHYPGCWYDENGYGGGFEVWHTAFTELFQEPPHENEKDKEKPMNTVTLQDAYLAMQEASGIKVGDTVRVLRKAEEGEMGWTDDWASSMDECVGKTGIVEGFRGDGGIRVNFSDDKRWEAWNFPFFVLEKIAEAPERFITINGFEVPEPVRVPLKMGEKYWVVSITPFQDSTSTFCREYTWTYDDFDYSWLERGLVHRTQEAAEKHTKALLSFTAPTLSKEMVND
jgi:hypothetical protein